MKTSIKKIASEAKSRLKSGYWEDMYKSRDEDIVRAKESGVGEEFVHGVYKTRHDCNHKARYSESVRNTVREIVDREILGETVTNPIGLLINRAVFDSLDERGRQRYILDLSEAYLTLRREIESEIKLSSLKG